MTIFKVNQQIRDLENRIATERPDYRCVMNVCDHDHEPLTIPGGIEVILSTDTDAHPMREVAVLIRFTKREYGGWHVVRADNGRVLGWVVKVEYGEYAGEWSAHVSATAFRGDGPDFDGSVLDRVPSYLHNGNPDGGSRTISYDRQRVYAASSIVHHLVRYHAPAVGYDERTDVTVRHTHLEDHWSLGKGRDEHCICGRDWPCPTRAALEAEAMAGVR
jgi:hypothetical protein